MADVGHYTHAIADVIIATVAGLVATLVLFPLTVVAAGAKKLVCWRKRRLAGSDRPKIPQRNTKQAVRVD